MADMKLHKILAGILLSVVLIFAVSQFLGTGAQEYELVDYDNETLEGYQQNLQEINDITNQTRTRIENVKANPLIPDVYGIIIVGGIGAVKTTDTSISVLGNIIIELGAFLNLGPTGSLLILVLVSIVIIVFIIGIILHAINKSERL